MKRVLSLCVLLFSFLLISAGSSEGLVELQTIALKAGRSNDVIEIGKIALEKFKRGERDTLISKALDIAGNSSVNSRRYVEAFEFYVAMVDLGKQIKHNRSISLGYNNIGNIYEYFGDYERAYHYYKRSYETATRSSDSYMRAASLLNLVNITSILGRNQDANKYFNLLEKESLHSPEETSFWRELSKVSLLMAEKEFSKSIEKAKEVESIANDNDFREDLKYLPIEKIAASYYNLDNLDSAIYYANKIINNPNSLKAFPDILINSYKTLLNVYEKKGSEDSINKYKILYVNLSDSIYNRREFNEILELFNNYEEEEVNSRIYTLNNQIYQKNVFILIVGLLLLILLGLFLVIYNHYRKLKNLNRLLISKNDDLITNSNENKRLIGQIVSLVDSMEEKDKNNPDYNSNNVKNSSYTIDFSEQQRMSLLKKISDVMQNETIISDSSFSLPQLAQLVNSNTTYVSSIINQTYNKNFKAYLNEYRIQIASRRLVEDDMMTIQAIAESVGFKSIPNFIATFKKYMGMTPSVYKKMTR